MSLEKVIDDKITDLLMKIDKQKLPEHVAIIMDGNGRWATRKGLPRSFGHKQGVSVLKKILKAAKNLGCKVITVYAFSTENWTRPTKEVDFLINLFSEVHHHLCGGPPYYVCLYAFLLLPYHHHLWKH